MTQLAGRYYRMLIRAARYTFLVASLIVLIFGPAKLPWTPSALQG